MPTTIQLDVGDRAKITATFTDPSDGTAVNPGNASFVVKDPTGTRTTYVSGVDSEVSNPSTGVYVALIPILKQGTYYAKVYSTGTYMAAESLNIKVRRDLTN